MKGIKIVPTGVVRLPKTSKRGSRIRTLGRGWRLLGPRGSRIYTAILIAVFGRSGSKESKYAVFKVCK
mgnify:CR=1 FL=1